MNTRRIALAQMLACVGLASARPPKAPPEGWAEKMFGPPGSTTHDFGAIPRGARCCHDFAITNPYDVPAEITSIRPSMGAGSASAWKRDLRPGEKSVISLQVDGRRFVGRRSQVIQVDFGPTHVATVMLNWRAFAVLDVSCDPGELAFGEVREGQAATATMKLEHAGSRHWRVNGLIVPHGAPFEAAVRGLHRRQGGVAYEIKAVLKKDAPAGLLMEHLALVTNDPRAPRLLLVVSGNVQPGAVTPSPPAARP